jgi:hypothetical protein
LSFSQQRRRQLGQGSLDGGGVKVISSDAAWFINVIGDWIYYSNRDDNNRIYKINIDGSEKTEVSSYAACYVVVIDD